MKPVKIELSPEQAAAACAEYGAALLGLPKDGTVDADTAFITVGNARLERVTIEFSDARREPQKP